MLALVGQGFWVALLQAVLFYYAAGAAIHWVIPRLAPVRSIQKHARGAHDVRRDALFSLGPLAVKAAVWTICERMHARGVSLLYTGGPVFTLQHALYMALCVLVLDYAHDSWFYWTHRLLHWKPLYRNVHYVHHRSSAPSAFTGYSFHVAEAALVFANEVLICFALPLHLGLHRVYHLFTTLIHQGGHAGYEMSPFIPTLANVALVATRGLRHGFRGFNTVQHHDMHHRYPAKHFSLYFTHWDRLCGTLHAKYDESIFAYFPRPGVAVAPAQRGPEQPQKRVSALDAIQAPSAAT